MKYNWTLDEEHLSCCKKWNLMECKQNMANGIYIASLNELLQEVVNMWKNMNSNYTGQCIGSQNEYYSQMESNISWIGSRPKQNSICSHIASTQDLTISNSDCYQVQTKSQTDPKKILKILHPAHNKISIAFNLIQNTSQVHSQQVLFSSQLDSNQCSIWLHTLFHSVPKSFHMASKYFTSLYQSSPAHSPNYSFLDDLLTGQYFSMYSWSNSTLTIANSATFGISNWTEPKWS